MAGPEQFKFAPALEARYRPKYAALATMAWISVGAVTIPMLAPYIALIPPVALTGEYIRTKFSERGERKPLSGSLVGILAGLKDN